VNQSTLIDGFIQLGKVMKLHGENQTWTGFEFGVTEHEFENFENQIIAQTFRNNWFTENNIRESLSNLAVWLKSDNLKNWLSNYKVTDSPKTIAVIMAGNIPLVGFHDFLCVMFSGHRALLKLSSDDDLLLPLLVQYLKIFIPEVENRIEFAKGPLKNFDAVIATGSNNSLLHFKSYFEKYPHLLRHNRTSVAVLEGNETQEELKLLGKDIFSYFGKGCRNVTHLIVPEGYDFQLFFQSIVDFGEIINNKKYGNNYDYNKAIHLMNQEVFLDNNFLLVKKDKQLHAPISMIYYHTYTTKKEIQIYLEENESNLQCIVGKGYLPFGEAQCPTLTDYADGVDTMKWLMEI
jgi:hypothetical protein